MYRSVRRQGVAAADAEDLTQSFFVRAIETRSLVQARLPSGCFRSYLLSAVRHFLLNQWVGKRARKRGGHVTFVTFDDSRTPCGCSLTCATPNAPDEQLERTRFERAWNDALVGVRRDAQASAAHRRTEALLRHLDGPERTAGYTALAEELGMTEAAVRVALHRLRRKVASSLKAAGYVVRP